MKGPERKFVGGRDKVTAENIYQREHADNQPTKDLGLSQDFLNGPLAVAMNLQAYQAAPQLRKEKILPELFKSASILKSYKEWMAKYKITPENQPAVFADDVQPYIETLNEINSDMKKLLGDAEREYHENGISPDFNSMLLAVDARGSAAVKIIQSQFHKAVDNFSDVNDLSTNPIFRKMFGKPKLEEADAIKKIQQRLEYGKELLKKGPLPGSFSYIRKDGNVLPVDWEPAPEDEQKLRESGEKNG